MSSESGTDGDMRGYQRKIIILKSTGSEHFDEAYFIVKSDADEGASRLDLVKEANRIIEENFGKKRRLTKLFRVPTLIAFAAGALLSLSVCLLVFL